ncbi:transmembrane sensor [Pedobacter africanus]|uniref:Ferric-dicitrate binding protein FerR (Iron transport regulator) n=1 Tax=Pedobacter africanus TaxID=151894 RepID=A0ACC6KZP6_9SPHI|nr:FecR domain-containing protein [Pedobacter africanus]MDR6784546.1 ferric-dicitrate binding protein FerR (iron transport regulator) [Pedobacter africanus]
MDERTTILSERLSELISGYLMGTLGAEEVDEVENWINSSSENMQIFREVLNEKDLQEMGRQFRHIDVESDLMIVRAKLGPDPTTDRQSTGKHKLWRYGIAAAVATIIFGAGLLYFKNQQQTSPEIAPGKQGATLTLANGKKIRLGEVSDGKLANESGVEISKLANGQLIYEIKENSAESVKINTLTTAKGETYRVRLPDGSLVYLNAASSLTYSSALNERGKRSVRLDGEGYFEVSKDKKHPFVVETRGQSIEVLGTHFNVNAYKDEPQIATTLLEGSVKVSVKGKTQLIRPGQQVVNYGGRLQVNEVSLDDITDWKEGDFFLNHVDFKTAMRKIARWYDVVIVYDEAVPEDLESGGWMSRRNNLSTVLKAIEDTGLARFRIEGKTVHVFK